MISFSTRPDVTAHVASLLTERPSSDGPVEDQRRQGPPEPAISAPAARADALASSTMEMAILHLAQKSPPDRQPGPEQEGIQRVPATLTRSAPVPAAPSAIAQVTPAPVTGTPDSTITVPSSAAAESTRLTYGDAVGTIKLFQRGELKADQFKASFEALRASEAAIKEELGGKTMKELAPNGARGLKKPQVIDHYYSSLVQRFVVRGDGSVSYELGRGGLESAVAKQVAATTDEDLQQYAKRIKERV